MATDSYVVVNTCEAEPVPGGLLMAVIAALSERLQVPRVKRNEDLFTAAAQAAIAFDPLYRQCAAALSVGPADYAGFALDRAQARRRLSRAMDLLHEGAGRPEIRVDGADNFGPEMRSVDYDMIDALNKAIGASTVLRDRSKKSLTYLEAQLLTLLRSTGRAMTLEEISGPDGLRVRKNTVSAILNHLVSCGTVVYNNGYRLATPPLASE